jgi:hypothetical protein
MEPQVRKAYLVGAALGLTVGVVITLFVLRPILDLFHQEEEERPPVVVSNGSVVIEVPSVSKDPSQTPIPENKKGHLKNHGGAQKQRQTGDNENYDKSVDYFDLWFSGASASECKGAAKQPISQLTSITIDAGNGPITITREQRGGSNKFDPVYTFPINVARKSKYRVELDNPFSLMSVTFNGQTCKFDEPNPWVQIWPR